MEVKAVKGVQWMGNDSWTDRVRIARHKTMAAGLTEGSAVDGVMPWQKAPRPQLHAPRPG